MEIDSEKLMDKRVTIVGLGLMGGSLAFALRDKCRCIFGVDPDRGALNYALINHIVDDTFTSLEGILAETDILILATPVCTVLSLMNKLSTQNSGQIMVMDLGSTKSDIVHAMNELPDRFDAVGGHPICGKEKSSIYFADSQMFKESVIVLCSSLRTTSRARFLAEQIVEAIGAHPMWLDAELHDRWTAFTSHFPYLASNVLASSIPKDAFPLAGPGLLSTTRLAGTNVDMMVDILISNRENIVNVMENFKEALNELEVILESGDTTELKGYMQRGRQNYLRFKGKDD